MARSFHPVSPRLQLAAELRRRIGAGELSGEMPGLRRLMADFGVTRTTAEGAVAELTREGLLRSRGDRRPFEIVRGRAEGARDTGTLVIHDDPMESRNGDHREILLAMESRLPAPVVRLCLAHGPGLTERIVARILESPCRRVVVMDHEAEVADRLAQAGRVVVAAGTAGAPALVSQVGVPHEGLVRAALRKAFEAGHRRVSFPIWRRKPEVESGVRRWIAAEYAAQGLPHSPDFDAPVVAGAEPAALHRTLRELLRHTPPTAMIAADFSQWLATVSVLGERGLRIPHDVSLLCLCSTPDWTSATPSPAHFRFPVAAMAAGVARALKFAGRGLPKRDMSLDPEWVPGGSLAAPRVS